MRYFLSPQRVTVPAPLREKAQTFAAAVTSTVGTPGHGYEDSQQRNLDKIRLDHWLSKIGEEAVKAVFVRLGHAVDGPDYQVYSGSQKSWTADLRVNGVDLAVKTQSVEMAERFGLSWTFQSGPRRRDPLLQTPRAWVCFVQAAADTGYCMVYPPYQIQELQFAEPKLSYLKPYKKVIYAQDLSTLAAP
ncbi:MAG: hypothetical protein ACO3NK_19960 [Prochlorotrichaceae cyanobacterium]